MEQTDNPAPASNNPNGFVNRVFNVSLDVENETSSVYIQEAGPGPAEGQGQGETPAASSQTHVMERQEVNRRPRAAGGIWRILNRKRAGPELERRPHSMILPGEASVPKLSFADKVRSFKKLKSPSVFRGKTGKLSTAKFVSSLADEESFCRDIGTPQQSGRSALRHRGKRHSYAGHASEFDCSFEDIDLAAPTDGHQPAAAAAGEAVTQNGCKLSERVCYTKRSQGNSNNCNKTAAGHDEPSVKGSPSAHHGRGRKQKDVWSYLRRISLLGKANPVYSERSFDSELPSLDKTMDSDYGSVDFESVRDFHPPPPKHSDPKGHFGGLFKFFNSVAETARKWRTTTHSFSPPEGEITPAGSPQPPVDTIHSVSLTLHGEGLPKPQPTRSSAATAKSSQSGGLDSEAPAPATGGRSPKVVLRAFRACPGARAVNGLQSCEGADKHADRDTNHRSTAVVENHIAKSGPTAEIKTEAGVESDPLSRLCQEEKVEGQTGNEGDSRDAPRFTRQIQEVSVQSQQGDKESPANSVPAATDSTEEIFKLCEQIASQTSCGVRQPGPAGPDSSTEKTSVPPHKRPRPRPRPRPASASLDPWRPSPDRDLCSHYSEVGSLCRRRRRPAPTLQQSRSRPRSVIETSVTTREMQSTELHHRALSRPPGVSPLEPPLRASLLRCRSLPLPPSTLTAMALLLPQSDMGQSSASVRLRSGGSGSCRRRRLLRPGSEPLQVNIVAGTALMNDDTSELSTLSG
ncbi:uncharacterized protein [Clinocottus analis]|uniref:uncharacterized protein n=1 Tax=Clinocottus analis TaxID=304258 RepID=UPI0035C19873